MTFIIMALVISTLLIMQSVNYWRKLYDVK